MVQLDPAECRVLGVLVEKAHTSSGYPMSLNAIVDGCNQKSNRHPVVSFDEDRVAAALDRLRTKELVLFADTPGSRVVKFRHNVREVLGVDNQELIILTELLLRGPQTAAELRLRASRMKPLETPEIVRDALARMIARPEPLVKSIPGGRAERFAQLLCPNLHAIEEAPAGPAWAAAGGPESAGQMPPAGSPAVTDPMVLDRLTKLEEEVSQLRQIVDRLAGGVEETSSAPEDPAPPSTP